MFYILFIVSIILLRTSESSKILAVFPLHYKSHFVIGSALVKELADKGHSVTIISPYELKHTNVNSIVLDNLPKVAHNVFSLADISIITNFLVIPQIAENAVNFTLSNKDVIKIMKEEQFDAVIIEIFMTDALFALGNHLQCPVIGLTTFGTSTWTNIMTRTPSSPSFVPNLFTSFSDNMNFFERFFNTLIWSSEEILWHFYHYPKQVALYKQFFPDSKVDLIDVVRNVSLILNNNHISTSTIKPYVPYIVDIGGIYINPSKPLPIDLQKFMDEAVDGVIVFSMGSSIQSVDWPSDKRDIFVHAFGKLKQKVLWKYENESLPNRPKNVMIKPWLPQRDVLAHPNVKLFITHGGLLGLTEAIYEGVPMLSIPIFGDQRMNMKIANKMGIGLYLDFQKLNENDLMNALDEILNGTKIKENVKKISLISRDRPMTPQQTAVYWTEYIIKHKGAPHLKSPALNMKYVAFNNIDVYFTLFFALLCFILVVLYVISLVYLRLQN